VVILTSKACLLMVDAMYSIMCTVTSLKFLESTSLLFDLLAVALMVLFGKSDSLLSLFPLYDRV
jgi:hypothetical protein